MFVPGGTRNGHLVHPSAPTTWQYMIVLGLEYFAALLRPRQLRVGHLHLGCILVSAPHSPHCQYIFPPTAKLSGSSFSRRLPTLFHRDLAAQSQFLQRLLHTRSAGRRKQDARQDCPIYPLHRSEAWHVRHLPPRIPRPRIVACSPRCRGLGELLSRWHWSQALRHMAFSIMNSFADLFATFVSDLGFARRSRFSSSPTTVNPSLLASCCRYPRVRKVRDALTPNSGGYAIWPLPLYIRASKHLPVHHRRIPCHWW